MKLIFKGDTSGIKDNSYMAVKITNQCPDCEHNALVSLRKMGNYLHRCFIGTKPRRKYGDYTISLSRGHLYVQQYVQQYQYIERLVFSTSYACTDSVRGLKNISITDLYHMVRRFYIDIVQRKIASRKRIHNKFSGFIGKLDSYMVYSKITDTDKPSLFYYNKYQKEIDRLNNATIPVYPSPCVCICSDTKELGKFIEAAADYIGIYGSIIYSSRELIYSCIIESCDDILRDIFRKKDVDYKGFRWNKYNLYINKGDACGLNSETWIDISSAKGKELAVSRIDELYEFICFICSNYSGKPKEQLDTLYSVIKEVEND